MNAEFKQQILAEVNELDHIADMIKHANLPEGED
jgi:hypothetical protein